MGGHGKLVLNTIGTAVEPILLLIGEENKHHGVLEVLRETIEAFPGVFDDTADMMRHGKARYAVEKRDDGLKYRVLDYDVAPQLPERQHSLWEQPKRRKRVRFRLPLTAVPKADAPKAPLRYGVLLGGQAYPPLPEVPHQPVSEKRPSARKSKVRAQKRGAKQSASENCVRAVHECMPGCACHDSGEARLQQSERRVEARIGRRRGRSEMHGHEDRELDYIIKASEMWEYDPDGDVVVKDEQDAVGNDGVLIAVDNTPLHSRVTWKDSDLQET
ncbi:MAG: hypothetical protein VXU50_02195, partial [Verrucomicrobiota bacterium]|nr:hypothetical protein [Verrucomicrobiota bacterium]